jgi:hypothetical protein
MLVSLNSNDYLKQGWVKKKVLDDSVVDFNPLSTNRAGLQPLKF